MNYRKHGARLLGLLAVAALGVMAFAASAQAVAPGFLLNKKPLAVGLLVTAGVTQENKFGTMLVPGLNFELNCETLTVDNAEITGPTHGQATLLYTKCSTLSITKLPEEIHCHVTEPITATALLLPAELVKPVLNGPAVLAEQIKALVKLHLPEASLGVTPCVLPLDNTVTGEVCFEIKNTAPTITNDTVAPLLYTDATVECRVKTELEKGTEGSGTIKDVLKYGAQTVTLDGAAVITALGPHTGALLGVSLF
jgi:hypothetical protein